MLNAGKPILRNMIPVTRQSKAYKFNTQLKHLERDTKKRIIDIDEAIGLLRAARGLNIIGGDVVCMMPTKDSPNNITALTAAAVMFEMISMITDNLKNN